jgi:hypothetical protein
MRAFDSSNSGGDTYYEVQVGSTVIKRGFDQPIPVTIPPTFKFQDVVTFRYVGNTGRRRI